MLRKSALKLANALLGSLAALMGGAVQGAEPSGPVTLVVAVAPAGAYDIAARALAPLYSQQLGQPVLIENRAGAGSQVAADIVARSRPDGRTLLISGGISQVPVFFKSPIVRMQDLAPVTLIADSPLILVAPNSLPGANFAEAIDYIKARPGQFNHASVGPGSSISLYFAALLYKHGLKMQDIAYAGPGPITQAMQQGDVQLALLGVAAVKNIVDSGKGRPLALAADNRLKQFPTVPTFLELGMPDVEPTWVAMHAAGTTPADLVARLYSAVGQAGKDADFVKRMDGLTFYMKLTTPDELRRAEQARFERAVSIAKFANIRPE